MSAEDTRAEVFTEIAAERFSARDFLPTPLNAAEIRGVLDDAQRTPSNSNTQPWLVHVVSGRARDDLSRRLLDAGDAGEQSPDFPLDYGQGTYLERSRRHGACLYGARGIERSDQEGRRDVQRENLDFYGAPHVALLFMPALGDGVRTGSDIGMYAQTFLLSLTARGLHGIPQAVIGMYAAQVREALGVSDDLKLLFGIAFGRANTSSPTSHVPMDRVPLRESVVSHGIDLELG